MTFPMNAVIIAIIAVIGVLAVVGIGIAIYFCCWRKEEISEDLDPLIINLENRFYEKERSNKNIRDKMEQLGVENREQIEMGIININNERNNLNTENQKILKQKEEYQLELKQIREEVQELQEIKDHLIEESKFQTEYAGYYYGHVRNREPSDDYSE